jgi:hypothetical protein
MMKERIESTLTLEEVAEHFAQWRRNKKKGERIPQPLWHEAIELVDTHGVSQVTRTLRLSATDLNKRRGMVGTNQRRQAAVAEAAFVEVECAHIPVSGGEAMWMELERPDGMRLRIRPTQGVDMLALVERFMGV